MGGQRDLLGRLEAATEGHRPGEVEHEDGGGRRERFGAVDLEVVLLEAHWHFGAFAENAVEDRLAEVEMERVAELVGLRVVGALAALALIALRMLAVVRLL